MTARAGEAAGIEDRAPRPRHADRDVLELLDRRLAQELLALGSCPIQTFEPTGVAAGAAAWVARSADAAMASSDIERPPFGAILVAAPRGPSRPSERSALIAHCPLPMRPLIARALNLRPGDAGRAVPLVVYLLLVIACYVVGQVARDALFLGHFPARLLPYADLLVLGVVVGLVWVYVRLGQRFVLGRLIVVSLAFFAALGVLFWFFSGRTRRLALLRGLRLGRRVRDLRLRAGLDAREPADPPRDAKRIYGLLGGGATVAACWAALLARRGAALGRREPDPGGQRCSAVRGRGGRRASCAGRRDARSPPRIEPAAASGLAPASLGCAARPYLRVVAAIVCLSAFVTAIAGWQFKAVLQESFANTDTLAAFLGAFNAGAGVSTLLLQALSRRAC